jgi:two-component system, chemotaxis family, sensor kinase CheA
MVVSGGRVNAFYFRCEGAVMDDLLSEFLTETSESLESLDLELVKLEQTPNDPELLGNIFRLIHTLKGTSGFLGLPRLESVAHHGENVLGNFRDGTQLVTPEAVSLILESLDCIKAILAGVEENETEPDGDDSDLIERLDAMYRAGKNGEAQPAAADVPAKPEAEADTATIYQRIGGASAIDAAVELMYRKIDKDPDFARFFDGVDMMLLQGRQTEFMIKALGGPDEYQGRDLRVAHQKAVQDGLGAEHFDKVAQYLAEALVELEIEQPIIDEILAVVGTTRSDVLNLDDNAEEVVSEPEIVEEPVPVAVEKPVAKKAAEPSGGENSGPKESAVANQSIRVTVDLLENLMTMVSELVLTRNQLMQMVRKHEDSEFKVPLQRLSHVTTDLQEGVMKTRMQPIGNAWGKLPRIIRDLAIELNKKIDLEMVGADTELDRQVLEIIKDPLTHMVRNSADHGLETPSERAAAGKSETGKVVLRAFHEGGHIIIEISDDGRGINIEKVREKAVSSGVCTQAELESLSEQQILQFVFKAGFSTAEKVTNVSGRGVGMDVVRTNIEKIGGQVELQSTVGKGSTVIVKIPLTLAIVSALIVECRTERYAIPQLSVVELVRITANSEHRMERINETPVLRLRDRLLPLVSMANLLKLDTDDFSRLMNLGATKTNDFGAPETIDAEGEDSESETEIAAEAVAENEAADDAGPSQDAPDAEPMEAFIVVCQVGTYSFGIAVDGVFDTEEIVVKPVAPILRDISIYSGNTILGDGSVIMILDPNGIAATTGEMTMSDQSSDSDNATDGATGDRTAFLVFRAGSDEPKAVPLALVARLEEIERSEIETSNGVPMVQYRGQLMPLLSIDGSYDLEAEGRQPVLVFTDRDRSMGLLVDEIVDIVEDRLNVELGSEQPGLLGSAVLDGKATSIIDASTFLTQAFDDWFGTQGKNQRGPETGDERVLLVDDSPFFRNLLTPLLTVAGYQVTTVESASQALALRDDGVAFDVIISDIEMPGMSGIEFATEVREGGSWQEIPLLALSAHTSPELLEKGRTAGFDDYVGKYDRDTLLESVAQTIAEMKGAA